MSTKPGSGTRVGIPLVGRGEVAVQHSLDGEVISVSSVSHFAAAWFADAMREVTDPTLGQLGARRREIVFSTLCAESYLVEWVMDQLRDSPKLRREDYANHHALLKRYFRKGQALLQLWEAVPRTLHREGHIGTFVVVDPIPPPADFERLIEMRNDITHGNISHPEVYSPFGDVESPLRTTSAQLAALRPGWAIETAVERIRALHRQVGTVPPSWLTAEIPD